MCISRRSRKPRGGNGKPSNANALNILLTNGRFPVTLDLARQLKRAGHVVFCVDPMHNHVCKFSNAVKKSFEVPAPHENPTGYLHSVSSAVQRCSIDLIIPLHEEIFYLAECDDPLIKDRLFAPPFEVLLRLHNKWEFGRLCESVGLDVPRATLCRSLADVHSLTLDRDLALKPVYGRASSKVYHLKPGEPIPEDVGVSEENQYVAQEWLDGQRYCSYSVVVRGKTQAFGLYPVKDTIDGSSCVYFESVEHEGIRAYTEKLISALGPINAQLAFDFIDVPARPPTPTSPGSPRRLVAIECNPRATSGIHLFSSTTRLAQAFTAADEIPRTAKPGARRQVAPGMLMWKRGHGVRTFLKHEKRLMTTKDVMFSGSDLLPSLMQPFLLWSYYEICREKKMRLADMFQWDLTWEPEGEHLRRVQALLERDSTIGAGQQERQQKEEKEGDSASRTPAGGQGNGGFALNGAAQGAVHSLNTGCTEDSDARGADAARATDTVRANDDAKLNGTAKKKDVQLNGAGGGAEGMKMDNQAEGRKRALPVVEGAA